MISLAITGIAYAGISGSKHDLTQGPGMTSTVIVGMCEYCHTPHNANTDTAPLWNHDMTGLVPASFTMYASGTLNGAIDAAPAGVSMVCFSCHDGATALEDFGGVTTGPTKINTNANLGTNLANDHPISITYDAVSDTGLHATTSAFGTITIANVLYGGKVECASCHDVHDDTNAPFLRLNNNTSGLCLACHNK
ncbi:MAG: cytochrome c3 family protein [Spirochaetia bacterium]|nr:cytochrome c3 family protein [Spirochaetia bacterium]